MKPKYLIFLICLGFGFLSCTDNKNLEEEPVTEELQLGEASLSLDFKSLVPDKQADAEKAQESSFTFTSGNIVIENLQFEVTGNGDSATVQLVQDMEELLTVDLATGQTTPDLTDFTIPAGSFEKVEVEMTFTDSTETTHLVQGFFTDANGVQHPIRMEFPAGETITLTQEGDFVFADSESVDAEITLNPGSWVSAISSDILNSLEKNEDGVIVISETMNANFMAIALDRLEQSSELQVNRP